MTASKKLLQASAGVGGGEFYPYTVDYSCRFNDNDSAYLRRVFGTPTNNKKWTYSTWVKRTNIVSTQLLSTYPSSGTFSGISLNGSPFRYVDVQSSASVADHDTNALFRDPSAWMHLMVACDTTNGTAADRIKYYCNGDRLTLDSTGNVDPSLNANTLTNSAVAHFIGAFPTLGGGSGSSNFGEYYLSQVAFVDGQALTPSSFGEDKNGVWVPKNPSGLTFGNNGFWLDFADSANLGNDVSGNNNDFTSSGLTSSDQVPDTPTNNYCTLNPIVNPQLVKSNRTATGVCSDGNLSVNLGTTDARGITSTFLVPTTGKWAFKVIHDGGADWQLGAGVLPRNGNVDVESEGIFFNNNPAGLKITKDGTDVQTGLPSIGVGQYIEMFIDRDASEVSFKKQGTTAMGTAEDISSYDGEPLLIYARENSPDLVRLTFDFGQTGYTPTEADYLSLCTANLPEPTLGPNSAENVTDHFAPVLYTGNGTAIGSGGKAVTGVGFQPDFTWIKNRDAADNHMWFNAVRGATKYLNSNLSTNDETTDTESLSTFDTDGFTLGNNVAVNTSGEDYVSWNWKGNGSGVTNTDGDVTSTVSVNNDTGISLVEFTTPGTAQGFTIGHGMDTAPDVVIMRGLQTYRAWWFWHKDFSPTYYYLYLSGDQAFSGLTQSTNVWNNSVPTSTVISTRSDYQFGTNIPVMAWCFAEKEGFSSFGSYTGNGSTTDGPFIYTGFRPAMVIIKSTSVAQHWVIKDALRTAEYNPANGNLYPSAGLAEDTISTVDIDMLSNGFKARGAYNGINASGGSYIYMAFAENPFKYSNAR